MIFDGAAFAGARREKLLKVRETMGEVSLGIVVSGNDPVTSSYVRIKERNAEALRVRLVRYPVTEAVTRAVVAQVENATRESGVIVQLPLLPGIDVDAVLAAIPLEKDVDALSPAANERLAMGDLTVIPPVAAAVYTILATCTHPLSGTVVGSCVRGKHVAVIGKGRLVGVPSAKLFEHLGASVQVLDRESDFSVLKSADIVVLGAGSPHLLKPEMVKDGVMIFDAGTSEAGGVVVGDADPACARKASFFTPVPGGIGPVAVVEIFSNLFALVAKSHK